MAAYATLQQFYALGLRAEAFVAQPRILASVSQSTSTFELPGHGLSDGELIRFAALGSGASLPAPLTSTALYPATTNGSDLFTAGVTLTGPATGLVGVIVEVVPKILEALEHWSRWVDYHLTAYSPPLAAPVPGIITMLVCHLAAYDLAIVKGLANEKYQQSAEALRQRAARAQEILNGLKEGGTIPGAIVDQTPSITEGGAVGWSEESRGWTSNDGVLR